MGLPINKSMIIIIIIITQNYCGRLLPGKMSPGIIKSYTVPLYIQPQSLYAGDLPILQGITTVELICVG